MVIMYLFDRYAPLIEWQNTKEIAYVVMLLAFSCIVYSAYLFHKHKTEIKPLEVSSHLILNWPYTVSRNPIYLSMTVFLAGWCLWLQSISPSLLVIVFFLWIQKRFILQEEQMLQETFMQSFSEYKQRVRRWI